MARQVRLRAYHVSNYEQTIDLRDDEVVRFVKVASHGDHYDHNWNILVITGPAETVEEMAAAMERTLKNAP